MSPVRGLLGLHHRNEPGRIPSVPTSQGGYIVVNVDKLHFYVNLVLGVVTAYLTVLFVVHNDTIYALGFGVAALLFWAALRSYRRSQLREYRQVLHGTWGEAKQRKRSFADLEEAHQRMSQDHEGFMIDGRTWEDLNMNDVFVLLDRTLTACGQQVLYHLLHIPLFDCGQLTQRGRRITAFQEDESFRDKIQMTLVSLGEYDGEDVTRALWHQLPSGQTSLVVARLLSWAAMASPLLFFWSPRQALMVVAGLFVVNMNIHYREQRIAEGHFGSLKYISRLVRVGQRLARVDHPEFRSIVTEIRQTVAPLSKLPQQVSVLGSGRAGGDATEAFVQYLNIFFLLEVQSYRKARSLVDQERTAAQRLFRAVGEIDALQAAASYRDGLQYFCEPHLDGNVKLTMDAAYHPLLEEPVANSLCVRGSGVLITGSNMSGKSTFLRTLGINALLAQTLFTCHARRYESPLVQLLTSIGRSDNVVEGKSYYLVEAMAVKRIIDNVNDQIATLAIIDEIFRGTNSEERIKASQGVLEYLCQQNSQVFCATHDLELVDLLGSTVENYYFREQLSEAEGLHFDYQLHSGPSTTKNALRLLRYLGYPSAVTRE